MGLRGVSPHIGLRSFVGFASCKTSVRTLSSILAWARVRFYQPYGWFSKAPLLSPSFFLLGKAGKDAWKWTPKVRHGCRTTERSRRFRGWGYRTYSINWNIDFFDKRSRDFWNRESRLLFCTLQVIVYTKYKLNFCVNLLLSYNWLIFHKQFVAI